MTAPHIDGVAIPDSLLPIGDYQLQRVPIRQAQAGNAYRAGLQQIIWTFDELAPFEYDWILDRLAGGVSKTVTALLWTDSSRRVLYAMTSGVLQYPEYENVREGKYKNVKLTIRAAMPLLTGIGTVITIGKSTVGSADVVRYG